MPTESEQKYIDDYVNLLVEITHAGELDLGKLKIVVDASSGAIGEVLKKLFEKININAFPVNFDTNPALLEPFPHSPVADSFRDLRGQVQVLGADMGAAFDERGERLVLIDNMAQVIPSKYTLQLLLQATDDAHDPGVSSDGFGRYYFKELGEAPQPIFALLKIITTLSLVPAALSHIVKELQK